MLFNADIRENFTSVSLGTYNGPKRKQKQCLSKIWGDKQRVIWYFLEWPITFVLRTLQSTYDRYTRDKIVLAMSMKKLTVDDMPVLHRSPSQHLKSHSLPSVPHPCPNRSFVLSQAACARHSFLYTMILWSPAITSAENLAHLSSPCWHVIALLFCLQSSIEEALWHV